MSIPFNDALTSACLNLFFASQTGRSPDDMVVAVVAQLGNFCVQNNLPFVHLAARGVATWQRWVNKGDDIGELPVVTINIKESK